MNAADTIESSGKRQHSVDMARWQKSVHAELYLNHTCDEAMSDGGTRPTYCHKAVVSKGMTVSENARERRGQCDTWLVDMIPNWDSISFGCA